MCLCDSTNSRAVNRKDSEHSPNEKTAGMVKRKNSERRMGRPFADDEGIHGRAVSVRFPHARNKHSTLLHIILRILGGDNNGVLCGSFLVVPPRILQTRGKIARSRPSTVIQIISKNGARLVVDDVPIPAKHS